MEKEKVKKNYLYPQITIQAPVELKERLKKAQKKFYEEKGIAIGSMTFSRFLINIFEKYLKEEGL